MPPKSGNATALHHICNSEVMTVESRTNRLVLAQSREHKVRKTKWSHSCQPIWLPVSYDTLVQEGNYLSHAWQGGVLKISVHVT